MCNHLLSAWQTPSLLHQVLSQINKKLFRVSSHLHHVSAHPKSRETPLCGQLKARIRATGPITVAEYMKEALLNPTSGYYIYHDMLGEHGDFATSPEISQLFGEMWGIWILNEWYKLGCPKPLQLVELGPGNGTLLSDVLRVFSQFERNISTYLSLHLVERSSSLKVKQAQKLSVKKQDCDMTGYTPAGIPVKWYSSLTEVPRCFTCFLAHEFFDALPVHVLKKTPDGWREVLIDVDLGVGPHHLRFILSRGPTPASFMYPSAKETRNHIEVCPEASVIMGEIVNRVEEDGGFALIADYGHMGTKEDTFRAFKNHKPHDPLFEPGEVDLTADVDFAYLKSCVNQQSLTFGPVPQRDFLINMGISLRLQALESHCTKEQMETLTRGYTLLLDPHEMGERFKFLAVFPSSTTIIHDKIPPAGFFPSEPS